MELNSLRVCDLENALFSLSNESQKFINILSEESFEKVDFINFLAFICRLQSWSTLTRNIMNKSEEYAVLAKRYHELRMELLKFVRLNEGRFCTSAKSNWKLSWEVRYSSRAVFRNYVKQFKFSADALSIEQTIFYEVENLTKYSQLLGGRRVEISSADLLESCRLKKSYLFKFNRSSEKPTYSAHKIGTISRYHPCGKIKQNASRIFSEVYERYGNEVRESVSEILRLRSAYSNLLGFKNFSEFHFARSHIVPIEVIEEFLKELGDRVRILNLFSNQYRYSSDSICTSHNKSVIKRIVVKLTINETLTTLAGCISELFGIKVTASEFGVASNELEVKFLVEDERGHFLGNIYLSFIKTERDSGFQASTTGVGFLESRIKSPAAFIRVGTSNPKNPTVSQFNLRTLFHEFGHAIHQIYLGSEQRFISSILDCPIDSLEILPSFAEKHLTSCKGTIEKFFRCSDVPAVAASFQEEFRSKLVHSLLRSSVDIRINQESSGNFAMMYGFAVEEIRELGLENEMKPESIVYDLRHNFCGPYASSLFVYLWADFIGTHLYINSFQFDERDSRADWLKNFCNQMFEQAGHDVLKELLGVSPNVGIFLDVNLGFSTMEAVLCKR